MLRYVLLLPCLILGFLAFQAHDETEGVAVAALHPDNDPRFSSIAGMNLQEQVRVDPQLMWEYSSAASKYSRAESRARAIKADLRDQRDAYLAFLVIFFVFFALTFLPWGKWVRLFSQGVNNTVTRSGAAVESIASQVSGENRTIIKREGLDRYSVSTELRNWKALLDEGVVTREEFEKAKAKILNGG